MRFCRSLVVAGALAVIAATAWGQTPATILKVAPSADVQELDPTRGRNLISRIYSQMVFDTLFALDHTLSPKPIMVDHETVSDDRLTYTFTLRPGLKFHDGSAVTTRDVVAPLKRWMDGTSVGAPLKNRLASLTTVDDLSFTMVLKEPFGLVEFMLAGAGAPIPAIMREKDTTRPDGVEITEPIGSGPFRYVAAERISGHRVVFQRYSDYAVRSEPPDGLAGGKIVKVDRVEWHILPDATTTAEALANGEVDFWEGIAPDTTPFLRSRDVTVRRTNVLPSVAFVRPNFQIPPFNDVRARRALALIFDQHDMMAAVAGGAKRSNYNPSCEMSLMARKKAPSLASAFKGRWRIEVMDLWDRDAIDLVEPGFVAFNGEEGEMRFIAVRAWLDVRYDTRDKVRVAEFSWEGAAG